MASTTVNFNLKTAGYANFANQTLTFTLLTAGAEGSSGTQDYIALPGSITATSDSNGDGSVTLFRNGKSGIDSVYEVVFPNRERAKFIIPSGSSTIELATLIVDNVPSGAATQQSTVFDAAIQRANHTGTQTLSTISDAGTIASQASNSVSISGGSISGVTLTASTANLTDASNKRLMTDAQEAKLDTVETNADVTDATNVTAAGALMDSELADLTGVKTLQLPDSTTISPFAKTILDDADSAAVKTTLGITDPTPQVNFVPRSISFTNTSSFLSLADNAALDVDAGDFTLAFWARLNNSGTEPILTKLSGTGYRLKFVSGNLILTMQDSSGSADFTLATSLNDSKWHVYVVTVDRSGNAIAYVDNVAQTGVSVSGTALTLANSGQFQIGSDGGSNAGDGIALGNYVALYKGEALDADDAGLIYFSPDVALTAGSGASLMVDLRKADKTFTDVSTNGFAVTTNGTIIFNEGRITSLDGATIGATTAAAGTFTSISASDGNITNVGNINCDSISADDAATGLNVIFNGTDFGDNKITLTDNLVNALDITESTNSYLKFTTTNTGEKVVLGKDLDISGDHDLIIGTSTGTKIGTATGQKIGFFNATPVAQQNGTGETSGFVAGTGTAVNNDSTFTGNVGGTAYRINDIVKALKNLGILAQ